MNNKATLLLSTTLVTLLLSSSLVPAVVSAEPSREYDLQLDTDGDGLKDYKEFLLLNAKETDTDHDGILDGDEDTDGDGLRNIEEQTLGTNLDAADSDGDGLTDLDELEKHNTNPTMSDSDKDHLDDGTELLYLKTNPINPDEDMDGILDGDTPHIFSFPTNPFNISGTMNGTSNVPKRVMVRETPNLLIQQVQSEQTFDIFSLDPTITFTLTIPYSLSSKKEDLALFRYDAENTQLIPVEKQKLDKKSNTIQAEFLGDGTFVILSKAQWKQSLRPAHAKKEKFQKFKGKAKVHGLPTFELNGDQITEDGLFKIKKEIKASGDAISLDATQESPNGNEMTLESTYKVNDIYTADGNSHVTATAITTESGRMPTVLIHGLTGGSTTWGFNDKWDTYLEPDPDCEEAVSSWQSFTGKTYNAGQESTYNNMDVHFVTSIADTAELGPVLLNKYGYTLHRDLFIFNYNAHGWDGAVSTGASYLKNYLVNLRSWRKSKGYTDSNFNLVGHSMGGLVSRYLVENLTTYNVRRLITIGTPHFGGDGATFGDLNREGSTLWADTTNRLKNNATIPYIGFAGLNPSYSVLVIPTPTGTKDVRGMYATGLGVPHTNSRGVYVGSWDKYVREAYKVNTGYPLSADIEDDWVRIDSALGSDYTPSANLGIAPVKMNYRFQVWHNEYGQHSSMRKYAPLVQYLTYALNGNYDSYSKD